jgi:hypothetical protein
MADKNSRAEQTPDQPDPTLLALVRDKVVAAQSAHDRRAGATRPRIGRRGRPPKVEAAPADTDPHTREVHALRSVFKHFGELYRQYRERTGERTPTALRAAATAFKQEPSLFTLVTVAGFLDELELLRP